MPFSRIFNGSMATNSVSKTLIKPINEVLYKLQDKRHKYFGATHCQPHNLNEACGNWLLSYNKEIQSFTRTTGYSCGCIFSHASLKLNALVFW